MYWNFIQTTKMNNYIIFGDQKSLEENNEFKYQNNNSSKEPGIVANPSKLSRHWRFYDVARKKPSGGKDIVWKNSK